MMDHEIAILAASGLFGAFESSETIACNHAPGMIREIVCKSFGV